MKVKGRILVWKCNSLEELGSSSHGLYEENIYLSGTQRKGQSEQHSSVTTMALHGKSSSRRYRSHPLIDA